MEKIAILGEQLEVDTYVVGTPRRNHASGNDRKYQTFADSLRQRTCKQVVLWDEALTTVEAADGLRAAGRSRRQSQQEIDMYAAAVILQAYLDDLRRRTP